jgi:hypothetical protein
MGLPGSHGGVTQMETRECWGGGVERRGVGTVLGISEGRGLEMERRGWYQRARSHTDGNQRMLGWRS